MRSCSSPPASRQPLTTWTRSRFAPSGSRIARTNSVGAALSELRRTFPFFSGQFKDMGYQIQRYLPGEFYHWHIDGGSHEFSQRQLVAVWYLNDVPGPGGTTEFSYQNVQVQPKAGSLLLFPPFWTHEHRSATLREGLKYIATTWVVFR